MFREGPYHDFLELHLSDEITSQWDRELMEAGFAHLWDDPDHIWWAHEKILDNIENIKRKQTKENADTTDAYVMRLLNEMTKIHLLNSQQRILIIETMAGRNATFHGGCRFICQQTNCAEYMKEVMSGLMDFECDETDNEDSDGWRNAQARLTKAKESYRKAYEMYYQG